jgi:hypothetical protein
MVAPVSSPPTAPPATWTVACCNCRRVRVAPGNWQPAPAGSRRADSHGICPSCLAALYPEYAEHALAACGEPAPAVGAGR